MKLVVQQARFDRALKRFMKKVEMAPGTIAKRIALELFTSIVQMTPVDTGRARASWTIAVGEPNRSIKPVGIYGDALAESVSIAVSTLALYGRNPKERLLSIWISNNLPYIVELEHGSSRKAPRGMVAVSLNRMAVKMNDMVPEL